MFGTEPVVTSALCHHMQGNVCLKQLCPCYQICISADVYGYHKKSTSLTDGKSLHPPAGPATTIFFAVVPAHATFSGTVPEHATFFGSVTSSYCVRTSRRSMAES